MDVIILPIYNVVTILLNLYLWVIIVSVILSWLLSFGVINSHNPFVSNVGHFLFKVTEPVLAPIRKVLPDFGGIDLSPILLILAIYFIQDFLHRLVVKFFM